MQIIHADFKKGTVQIRITEREDLWHLTHIISSQDLIKGFITRKIKVGENESSKNIKKSFMATIEAESVNYDEEVLRINGRIREGSEELPLGSYQSITLEVGSLATLVKKRWAMHEQRILEKATIIKKPYLLCLLDREQALFALTKGGRYNILTHLQGEVAKKGSDNAKTVDFYQLLAKQLDEYLLRYNPSKIIVCSPAFYAEELAKKVSSLVKKVLVLGSCSDVHETAIVEVLKDPKLATILVENEAREENLQVDDLLKAISSQNATYGLKEVTYAAEQGAIRSLFITENFIHTQKAENNYEKIDSLLELVEKGTGSIRILSSEFSGGKRVDGLGGIAAILRYKYKEI